MITLLIVLGILAVYMTVGYLCGRQDVPRHLNRLARRHRSKYDVEYWNGAYSRGEVLDHRAREAAKRLILFAFLWPFIVVPTFVGRVLLAEGQRVDPVAREMRMQEQIQQQEKYIEKLERERERDRVPDVLDELEIGK